jgi:hypothetical protein
MLWQGRCSVASQHVLHVAFHSLQRACSTELINKQANKGFFRG